MTATVRDKSLASSWIDGVAVQTGGPAHRVINPADGSIVAELALATPGDVDRAVSSARAAFAEWSRATPADRSAVLGKLAELMDANADTFIAEEVAQCGKPVRLATEFDVPGSVDNIAFFAGAAFLAAAFLAGAFFAGAFLAGAFLAGGFRYLVISGNVSAGQLLRVSR